MEYALPLGNGQLGATIRGGIFKDEIQFNEKTLWQGSTGNGGGENNSRSWYQNFGSVMVTDMLLQSYDDVITILPALPSSWKNGSVKGLKAQGNYTVDEEWSEGKATAVRITNNQDVDRQVSVRYDNKVATFDISANATLDIDLSAGLPTGVNKVVNVPVSTIKTIYDLSGRRVNKAEKGVYIINGQKVVF